MKELKNTPARTFIDRKNISISGYLRDVNKYPMLTPEEEVQLASDIKKGDKAAERAKRRLVEANLRFVISVANMYQQGSLELPDLISEGNIGLMKAAESYDPTRGCSFCSYAVWFVRQHILAAIDNSCTTLRLPSNQIKLLLKYRKMDEEMMQEKQQHISIQEFCMATGLTEERATQIIAASLASVKMDAPYGEDSDYCYGDFMPSDSRADSTLDHESLSIELFDVFSHILSKKETDMVRRHYGIGCEQCTIETIAEDYGLTYERSRMIIKNAIKKIKDSKYSRNLVTYLAA